MKNNVRELRRFRRGKRNMSFMLVLAMVFAVMPNSVVRADVVNIPAEDSVWSNGNYDIPTGTYGSIVIPEGDHHLTIAGTEVTATSVEIQSGATLHIFDDENGNAGSVSCSDITAQNGARMELGSKSNIPAGIQVYDKSWDEETQAEVINDVSDGTWEWATFKYDSNENKWLMEHQSPYQYSFNIVGASGVKISFKYSVDGTNYNSLITDGVFRTDIAEDKFIHWSDEFSTSLIYNFEQEILGLGEDFSGNIKIELTIKTDNTGDNRAAKEIFIARYGEVDLLSHVVNEGSVSTFAYDINIESSPSDVSFDFDLAYPKEGDKKAKELIESDIYAYGDLDTSGAVDEEDMKRGLAAELYDKYFCEEEGGMLDGYFEISQPSDLYGRIEITADGTYNADNAGNSQEILNKYQYKISLGVDHEGYAVEANGYVYALRNLTDILVYDGNNFYIRNLATDGVSFNGKSDDDIAVCVLSDFGTVENLKINGNGGGSYENINPENSNIFTVYLSNEGFVSKYNRYYASNVLNFNDSRVCNKLRIMKPQDTYVAIRKEAGDGEQLKVPGINFDSSDSVCETGDDKYTEVFVGDNILHINPVAAGTGLTNIGISSVSLSAASQTDGIVLTKMADDDYKIEFKSNFYDEAKIEITYADGTTRNLTIKRQALVISYSYLIDYDDNAVHTCQLFHGGELSSTTVDYNYSEGQQVAIYATYYHPSGYTTASGDSNAVLYITDENGSVRIIQPLNYTAENVTTVATTDYLIALVPAKAENPDGTWGEPLDNISQTPFNALVVNGGYDNNTTFSGTQIGNGQGVYWDGIIEWNY